MAEYIGGEWRLTDQELEQIKLHHSGSLLDAVEEAQKAKKLAYFEANAQLIVSAVNSCISLNPENPLAVAEGIKDALEMLEEVRDTAVLQKQENGFYLLRLQYSTWQDACKALASIERGK